MSKFKGHKVNEPGADNWVRNVGKFIINFGSLEKASYFWISDLTTESLLCDQALDMGLVNRIELILKMIDRSKFSDEDKEIIKDLWGNAKKLATLRNTLAHNPLVLVCDETGNELKSVFIPDIKKMLKGKHGGKAIMLEELLQGVDDTHRIASSLEEYRNKS